MDYRSTRNRKGQTGLTYAASHTSTHKSAHPSSLKLEEKPNNFTRILLFQVIAAAVILSIFTGIRIINDTCFKEIQSGMRGETLAGRYVEKTTQEIINYVQDSEIFSQLLPSNASSPQGDSARWTSVFLDGSSIAPSIKEPCIRPINDTNITSYFGSRNDPFSGAPSIHNGWDMSAEEGTDVFAAWQGIVRTCSYDDIGGYYVVIEHAEQTSTYYGHLSQILVEVGQQVNAGDRIGLSGNSGKTTRPHLHFEIAQNGTPVDPALYRNA